ncbi:hypothetical protein HOK22_01110, partial [Candidatus Peregrinibacteria bacterium]|nr:hypothetical protein [Candidatus Peregrinibacteria bacterium]
MKLSKKLISIAWLALGLLSFVGTAMAAEQPEQIAEIIEEPVRIEVFERYDCKHCQDEEEFLTELLTERSDILVTYYDLYEEENEALWKELAELEGIPKVTPITLIGNTIVQGFGTADTTGVMMETIIDNSKGKTQYSFQEFIDAGGSGIIQEVDGGACEEGETCSSDSYTPLLVN